MLKFLGLSPIDKTVIVLAMAVATACAQKVGTNDLAGVTGTNDVSGVSGTNDVVTPPPMTMLGFVNPSLTAGYAPNVLSPDEIAQGYRLASVSTNEEISYAAPADATEVGTWHLTGAYEDVLRVSFVPHPSSPIPHPFLFPLGTNLCESLWAYTWGKVRAQLKNASNELVAVGSPMSALPGVSRFWAVHTTNDTFLLTWENFAAGRVEGSVREGADETMNAQLELYRNGDFVARSNDVESVYRRVNPDDWDDDGWMNDEDQRPFDYDEGGFGPHQDLSFTTNLDAYCWVDLVVHQADARVVFVGDSASDLPDPSFTAESEATNRVSLLIGKSYCVTCDMPFEIVGRSSPAIDEWWERPRVLCLHWPVDIWAMEGNGSGFRMHVSPAGLGGFFNWTACCCSVSGNGMSFSVSCREACGCGGCCAQGEFVYEGYAVPVCGGSCGCGGGGEEDDHDPTSGDSPDIAAPHAFAYFTDRVIFLEDAYDNSPTEHVPWQSTTASLVCCASGGEYGGRVEFSLTGGENLIWLSGEELPFVRELEPFEEIAFTNVYKAVSESASENAIVASVTFEENETGWQTMSQDRATAVRVEIEPVVMRGGCPHRHRMGIREEFFARALPDGAAVVSAVSEDWNAVAGSKFECPIRAAINGIRFAVAGMSYSPDLSVVEPIGIVCSEGFNRCFDGCIAMELQPYVTPLDVCFSRIRVMEVPTFQIGPSGYFTNSVFSSVWYHTTARGAGVWHRPGRDNFFFNDIASFSEYCPPPVNEGNIDWLIPLAWAEDDATSFGDRVGTMANEYHQTFSLDAQGGLRIDKFSQWIKCSAEGRVTSSPDIR